MKHAVHAVNGLRERKKARTREAIIDAALDLFASKGFEATTIEDIAAAADVSPRTFFRYFESKVDLVMARNEAHGDKIGPRILARPASEGPLEAMRQALQQTMRELLDDPSVVRELQVMLSTPTLRNRAREHFYEEEAELVTAFAARLGTRDDDRTANIMASAAAGAIWAVIERWLAEGSEVERLAPMIDEAFTLLEQGFSPARQRARRGGSAGPARRQSRQDRQPQP
jgi:AcrR family transcriptional regulator